MSSFVSSNIFIEWRKVIPLSAEGTSFDSFLWSETTWGTEHNLLALLHPMPRLDRWDGQMVISAKPTGLSKIPHLANTSSISVSTPENCKQRLWLLISLLHVDRGTIWVDCCLARSSAPQTPSTISKKEQDIAFTAVKAPALLSCTVYDVFVCYSHPLFNWSCFFPMGKKYYLYVVS